MNTRHADMAMAAAIGLLAYLTADVAHHALGHGVACLASGGQINSLSSIFVDCTVTGAVIDLAGPFANLIVGVAALMAALVFRPQLRSLSLFLLLTAAFNLFWFFLQLAFSAATRTDDWAWPIHYYGISEPIRYTLMAVGALGYWRAKRTVAAQLGFSSRVQARHVLWPAWLAAGAVACLTAAFDHHPVTAVLVHAAPQALLLSIGLPLMPYTLPRAAAPDTGEPLLALSWYWIGAAVIASGLSAALLGPGFAFSP